MFGVKFIKNAAGRSRVRVAAAVPRDTAMWRHLESGKTQKYLRIREDGFRQKLSTDMDFFTTPRLAQIESRAMSLCRGKILDVGAGSGRHALLLQELGADVTALEISPLLVKVMEQQGVKKILCRDVYRLDRGTYDTIYVLMHGIGLAGDLHGLERLLVCLGDRVPPGGLLLLDSYDFLYDRPERVHRRYFDKNRRRGRYAGEYRSHLVYRNLEGESFAWLYVDTDTLAECAERTGWQCRIVLMEETGDYLARLQRL